MTRPTLTQRQQSAIHVLRHFDCRTPDQVRTLLDLWDGRHFLDDADIAAIVQAKVGWLAGVRDYVPLRDMMLGGGEHQYDRDDTTAPLPADVDGYPLGRAAHKLPPQPTNPDGKDPPGLANPLTAGAGPNHQETR